MTNYDFESRMSFDASTDDQNSARKRIQTRKETNIIDKMREIWDFTKQKLAQTQENQKHHADKKKNVSFEYVVENEVWLSIKNIKTERLSRKLNHKWIESYKIKKVLKVSKV
jgi:undecaprenyl pyrophosphate synthase